VDGTTNRLSGFGYYYDQNGNLTNMPQQNAQMTYDSSNRMTRFSDLNDAESYQYAPDNKRVWRSKGCSYYNYSNGQNEPRPQIIFYSVFGQKMGEYCLMDDVTVVREYVYFGGRMVARTNGANLESFKTDRLHSNQEAPGGGFFPYGETKSGAAMTGESFATYSRDWHELDYASQRHYLPGIGRFSTSDPYLASGQGVNNAQLPLTWNKYSYVVGDPVNLYDPPGLSFYAPSLEAPPFDVWGGGANWLWVDLSPPMLLDPPDLSDPHGLAMGYGMIGSGQSLTALTVNWSVLSTHVGAIAGFVQGGGGAQGIGLTVLNHLFAQVGTPGISAGSIGASNLAPVIQVAVIISRPMWQRLLTTYGPRLLVFLASIFTKPGSELSPLQPLESLTDPNAGWIADAGGDWWRPCPPGSARPFEKLHFDPGINQNKGEHWDHTDCNGHTWRIWPDGSRTRA
jgi:RHS repeat-associated protein